MSCPKITKDCSNFMPIWPDAITHFGDRMPTPKEMEDYLICDSNAALCADALMAWGNCYSGFKAPISFGMYMVIVFHKLGVKTPEELSQYGDKIIKELKEKK